MKSLALGNTSSDWDLLAVAARALRTVARDDFGVRPADVVSIDIGSIATPSTTDELLETTYAAATDDRMGTDGHRMKQLVRETWIQMRRQMKSTRNLVGEVFDPDAGDTRAGPNWQAWCNKAFHRLRRNSDERLAETTLLLTRSAAQLGACVAEDQLLRFMRACVECSADRQMDHFEAPVSCFHDETYLLSTKCSLRRSVMMWIRARLGSS